MTLQQLEYIIAVYRHKHFAKAAACTSSIVDSGEKIISSNVLQFAKAPLPIFLSEAGHVILVMAIHPFKASFAISTIVSGSVISPSGLSPS